VNQQRSTRVSSIIDVMGMDTLQTSVRVKPRSLVKILIEAVKENVEEDGLEVIVHQQDNDSNASVEECKFNDCIRTLGVTHLTPSYDRAQLEVLRCTLAQPE